MEYSNGRISNMDATVVTSPSMALLFIEGTMRVVIEGYPTAIYVFEDETKALYEGMKDWYDRNKKNDSARESEAGSEAEV